MNVGPSEFSKLVDSMPDEVREEYFRMARRMNAEAKISRQAIRALALFGTCSVMVIAFLYCQAFESPSWQIDPEVPYITRHVPHFFANDENYLYRWGIDKDQSSGWLPLDRNGIYHGQSVLIYPDGNAAGDANPPHP